MSYLAYTTIQTGALRESVADGLTTNRPASNFVAALYRALTFVCTTFFVEEV